MQIKLENLHETTLGNRTQPLANPGFLCYDVSVDKVEMGLRKEGLPCRITDGIGIK